jgi:low affinity Fe/Cu permease
MIKNKNQKKSQSFSIDILVVVAVLLFGIIFLVANKVNDTDNNHQKIELIEEKAQEQSNMITEELKKKEILDAQNNIEVEKLLQLDIQDLKETLNIDNDFCIVFEKDGNLVKIDSENNINGIGTDKIIVNGQNCVSS